MLATAITLRAARRRIDVPQSKTILGVERHGDGCLIVEQLQHHRFQRTQTCQRAHVNRSEKILGEDCAIIPEQITALGREQHKEMCTCWEK